MRSSSLFRRLSGRCCRVMALLALSSLLIVGQQCIPDAPPPTTPPPDVEEQPRVTVETTSGNIVLELFIEQAPQSVNAFLAAIDAGYYADSIFHEVRAGSRILGGRYDQDLVLRGSRNLFNEANNGLTNIRGRVALFGPEDEATGVPHFMINLGANSSFDYVLDAETRPDFTVIGRVISGFDAADGIGAEPTTSRTAGDGTRLTNIPQDDVRILRISRGAIVGPGPGENQPPTAVAGADQTVQINTTVTLDGSASSDPNEGDTLAFLWRQTGGSPLNLTSPLTAVTMFTPAVVGTYVFELTVTDRNGLSDTDDVIVTVNSPANRAPVARAGNDQSVNAGSMVTLDGSASSDPDAGQTLSFSWTQVSGEGVILGNSNTATATFVAPPAGGALEFRLTVTDGEGGVATDDITVTVNTAPTADAGEDHNVAPGVIVTLDASSSSDAESPSLSFAWEQIGGPQVSLDDPTAETTTFTVPDEEGTLVFELTAEDSQGLTATDTISLNIRTSPQVRMATSSGDMVIEMLVDEAPITTRNFLQYVEDRFYDDTIFHRVIREDTSGLGVAQGGGFFRNEDDLIERKAVRDPIVNEFSADRPNVRGTLSMAKTSDPDSATSQFFFNVIDNPALDNPDNSGGFAVFASVVEGLDVMDAIGAVETGSEQTAEGATFNDVPLEDVTVFSARVE